MTKDRLQGMSMLALAHVGDAVYELFARTCVCNAGAFTNNEMHRRTVAVVSAEAMSRAAALIEPELTDEEHNIYRRGRNANPNSVPKHASAGQYGAATALEALFGWLYLTGNVDRARALFLIGNPD